MSAADRAPCACVTREQRPEVGDDLIRHLRSWERRRSNITVRAVLLERDGILDRLSGIDAPTPIVSGAEDAILPAPLSRTMQARCRMRGT